MVEQHLVHALEVASEWLMVLEGTRIIYSNHGLPDVNPVTDNRFVGLHLEDVLPGDRCEGLEDLFARMNQQAGGAVNGILRCFDEGLGPSTLMVRGERIGGFTYLSLRRPLDEEDVADGKLMEVEDKLSALLGLAASAGLGVGVFELSSDGELLPRSFNEHIVSIFDRAQEEMVGTNPVEWMHPDDRGKMEAMVRELRETGSNRAPVQLRALDRSGGVVHIQVSNSMLSPPNEHLGISFIQDLTSMREALDQQNRMVQAMERVEDTVVLADAMGRIFYANSTALRNTGYTLEEVLGRPISIFTAPEGAEEFADQAMMEFLRKGWWRGSTMASTKDGKLYPVEVVGTAVRDDQGELSMIVVISRKTQERQRFEAQLLMAKSNSERLVDHMEQRLLPDLEGAIERMGTAQANEIPKILNEMRATLRKGREVMDGLPRLEEARNLGPVRLVHVLEDRLPSMMVRHKVAERNVTISIRASDKELVVMANDMLPDLIVRILEVLMEMAEFGRPKFAISIEGRKVSDVKGSRVAAGPEGTEPLVAAISISCPGLTLSDDLRAILTRQELHTLGPLTHEQTLAVETSRLLLFLYEGRIITERSSKTGEESVVILLRQV